MALGRLVSGELLSVPRAGLLVLVGAPTLAASASARADDRVLPHVEVGASIAYAAPFGEAERGGRVSDTTFGAVPLRLDGAYAITSGVAVTLALTYAPSIPTLCQSAGDCIASVGSDLSLSVGARARLPRLGPMSPRVDCGVGYEWLTTKFVEAGASSERAYSGPLLAVVEVQAPFRLGAHLTLGPAIGARLGVFANEALDTPAFHQHQGVPDRTMHGWLTLGLRLGWEL